MHHASPPPDLPTLWLPGPQNPRGRAAQLQLRPTPSAPQDRCASATARRLGRLVPAAPPLRPAIATAAEIASLSATARCPGPELAAERPRWRSPRPARCGY